MICLHHTQHGAAGMCLYDRKKAWSSINHAILSDPTYPVTTSSRTSEPVFLNVYGAQEPIPRNESASLRSLAGRYDNPIPPRFLAPIDSLKIPALIYTERSKLE
jgi:hypothetical protein